MRDLFGVEFVAGVPDHAPVAQEDASLGVFNAQHNKVLQSLGRASEVA
jgi:hypothetical protein